MKLIQRATFSDLELARTIAARLGQRRSATGAPEPPPSYVTFGERGADAEGPPEIPVPGTATVPIEPAQPPGPMLPSSAPPWAFAPPEAAPVADPLGALVAFARADGTTEEPGLPEPPEWSEILADCRVLASAQGVLLLDCKGGLLESSGDWPVAGVRAVAAKLQPIIEKKDREVPGGPVPLRLGDRVLTAWRLTLGPDRVTVAVLGSQPLAEEVRSGVERQLLRRS